MFFSSSLVHAQLNEEDPFFNNYTLGANAEIVTLNGGADTALVNIFDATGDVTTQGITLLQSNLIEAPWGMVTDSSDAVADLLTGDFDGDGMDEFVGIWAGPDSTVTVYYTDVNPSTFSFENASPFSMQSLGFSKRYVVDEFDIKSIVRLEKIQIDTDPEPEFVVAYWGTDAQEDGGPIEIVVFDNNGGNSPQVVSSINDQRLTPEVTDAEAILRRSSKFEINAGDFDGDETDELVLIHVKPQEDVERVGWQLVGTVYDLVDGGLEKVGATSAPFFSEAGSSSNYYVERLAMDAADYNGNGVDEIALVYGRGTTNVSEFRVELFSIKVETDLSDLSIVGNDFQNNSLGSDGWPMSMTSFDINLDGNQELFYTYRNRVEIVRMDENLMIIDAGGATSLNTEDQERFHRTITVTDVDILESDSLRIEVATLDGDGIKIWQNGPGDNPATFEDGIHIGPGTNDYTYLSENTAMLIASGDFDGDAVRLGSPTVQTVTDIVQPLVVLNAPPIHFEVFDQQIFDVNKCFNDDPQIACDHRAVYENATSQEFEVATEVSADWGISESLDANVGAGFGPVQASVSVSLERGYGGGFSRRQGTSQTVTVKVTSDAIDDDRIYATISNYDVLEYPVYSDNQISGYVVVALPKFVGLESLENTWFGSKSGLAKDYNNYHEVGNILSYPSNAALPEGASLFGSGGFSGGGGDTWELSNSSTQTWELSFSSESISQRTRNSYQNVGTSASVGVGVGYGGFQAGLEVSVSGTYGSQQLSTHTTTVKEQSALKVEFGTIDGAILGTKTYTVAPFVYWGPGGALTLDYGVNPDESDGVASWWEENYGVSPDLTFILPWKYDAEKGLGSTNPELQSEETRDIIFSKENPQPGDMVDITARIQNFSLANLAGEVEVQFYLDDPRDGGTLITNEQQVSTVTLTGLEARSAKRATLEDWLIPEGVDGDTFIYAVIDGNEQITEVHEDNNRAWVLLNSESGTSVSSEEIAGAIPDVFSLNQNYPNPFNPSTLISYNLPVAQKIALKVYDVMGREVATLVDNQQSAGEHSVQFNASGLASGLYLYRLEGEQFSISRRMMLIK
ncbi:MAG: T9SS type A sorting domain-containing protein [Gracilimonas sp.]